MASWFQGWEFSASVTYIVTFRLDNHAFLFMLAKFLEAMPRRLQLIREDGNSGSDLFFFPKSILAGQYPFSSGVAV